MPWWFWIIFGCGLLAGEVLTPGGFYFFFTGIGAFLTALVALLPIEGWMQWLAFCLLSIVFLLFFRARLVALLEPSTSHAATLDGLVGMIGSSTSRMGPNEVGQVEVRGTHWSARNVGSHAIAMSQRCKVESIDGLTLLVKGE